MFRTSITAVIMGILDLENGNLESRITENTIIREVVGRYVKSME